MQGKRPEGFDERLWPFIPPSGRFQLKCLHCAAGTRETHPKQSGRRMCGGNMKFKLTALVLLVFALSACAPALPAPTPTATLVPPTLTPIPEKTPTPTETPLADGTLIPVDTTKEGWISEFPGLEEAVKVDAEGNGTLTLEGRDFGYHSKDTIFKIAGEDKIVVGIFEFAPDENGEYHHAGERQVFAPDGQVDPDTLGMYPSIHEEDIDLLNFFRSKTNNQAIFDELPIARKNLIPDHYKAKNGYIGTTIVKNMIGFNPVPSSGNSNRFANMASAFPVWIDVNAPIVHIIDKGYCFPWAYLQKDNSIVWVNAVISDEEFLNIDMLEARRDIRDYFSKPFLSKNNPNHQELIDATFNKNDGWVNILPADLISKVLFSMKFNPLHAY
jgi:hypothetical protein